MKKIMKRALQAAVAMLGLLVAAFFILAALPIAAPPAARQTAGPLVIDNVSVVELGQGVIVTEQRVVIESGRILAVGPMDSVAALEDAERIDGGGKFLMPALWDMHAHHGTELSPQLTMPLLIAAGVTHIRDMGGYASLERKTEWNRQIQNGELLGPRVMGQTGRFVAWLEDENEAREIVRSMEAGQDFIKVYNQVLPEPYFALLAAANEKGVSVVGHRPRAVSAIEAAKAGHLSFEHARLFLFESFPGASELRRRYAVRYTSDDDDSGRLDDTDALRAMLDEHDPEMFDALVAAMVENGTWFCPTHVTRKMDAFADDEDYRNDARLKYIPLLERLEWSFDADGMIRRDPTSRGRQTFTDFYERGLELTGKAHRAGVKILAGSDVHDTYCFPGFGLHDELQEMVKAGLTPAEALRTATTNPAEYFGLTESHGSIAEGKLADLLLLDADPLVEISNTTRIHALIYGGNLYDRDALDELLSFSETWASSLRVAAWTLWND